MMYNNEYVCYDDECWFVIVSYGDTEDEAYSRDNIEEFFNNDDYSSFVKKLINEGQYVVVYKVRDEATSYDETEYRYDVYETYEPEEEEEQTIYKGGETAARYKKKGRYII